MSTRATRRDVGGSIHLDDKVETDDHTDEDEIDEGDGGVHLDGHDERLDALQSKTDKAREEMLKANRRGGLRDDQPTPRTDADLPKKRG